MFDAAPVTINRVRNTTTASARVENEQQARRAEIKREGGLKGVPERNADDQDDYRNLEVIAHWSGSVHELRNRVCSASDWGPFELVEAVPAYYQNDGESCVYCRFIYHGPKAERVHFESNLRTLLSPIAKWETVSSIGRAA